MASLTGLFRAGPKFVLCPCRHYGPTLRPRHGTTNGPCQARALLRPGRTMLRPCPGRPTVPGPFDHVYLRGRKKYSFWKAYFVRRMSTKVEKRIFCNACYVRRINRKWLLSVCRSRIHGRPCHLPTNRCAQPFLNALLSNSQPPIRGWTEGAGRKKKAEVGMQRHPPPVPRRAPIPLRSSNHAPCLSSISCSAPHLCVPRAAEALCPISGPAPSWPASSRVLMRGDRNGERGKQGRRR